ncbi:Alpha/beta-hydrolase [Mycena sanguinolenta]|uniref:Alpha/beta-hydrolase n=1 Tax=Mycena sanguinolenta TaxID=230812 RepID=A0A8H6XP48_9AGAR|nr:Alpha/beta-hydrolase [Mycena sanguinolenta]
MSTPKPTIIVIPGSFSPLTPYLPIISGLQAHGYPVHGVELVTVGRREGVLPPGMYDDAAKVAALATQLADEGKDVVLVPHSYGGLVACEAAKGLAKNIREREGKAGGIVRIVFVTAVVPREGQALADLSGEMPDYVTLGEDGYLSITNLAKSAPITFSSLTPDEALAQAEQLSQHSALSFAQKLTYPAYKDIPVSYLFCEDDKLVTPAQQEAIIAGMESGGKTVQRFNVKADHAINVSQPETVVDMVRKALGDAA